MMKRYLAGMAALGLVGVFGCGSGSSGGPGATGSDHNRFSQADDTFSLSTPTLSTHIKQGEAKVVEIGIKRGKNFSQDVGLKLDGLPTGVTADPAVLGEIKAGENSSKVTLKAANDAAVGDFTVKVVGHPGKGADATNELKLTIEKK